MIRTDPQATATRPRIRRSEDRHLQDLGWSRNRMTFSFAEYQDPDWMGFGPLRVLIESHFDPHSGFPEHPHRDAEILSYITEGVLRHRDSSGYESDLMRGDMQLISAGSGGMMHSERNPQDDPEAHYQIWFVPDRPDTDFAYHERRPFVEEQQGQFDLYVSPDGRGDTMPINTDAFVSAGHFSAGDSTTYEVQPGRGAWVQVVEGTVTVGDVTLRTGDGAGFRAAGSLPLSFSDDSEVLLMDVRMDAPRVWE